MSVPNQSLFDRIAGDLQAESNNQASLQDRLIADLSAGNAAPQAAPQTPGFIDSATSAAKAMTGAGIASLGTVLEDAGAQRLGQPLRAYGEGVQQANPSSISSLGDLIDKPRAFIGESVGQFAAQLPVSMAGSAAGARLGGALPLPPQARPIAAAIGGLGGAFLPNWVGEYGETRANQRETGMNDPGLAAQTSALAAGFDTAGDLFAMRKFFNPAAGQVARELLPEGASRLGNIAKEFGKAALVEGGTEIPQTALERLGGGKDINSPEAWTDYGVGFGMGAVGGGLTGAVGGAIQPRAPVETQDATQPVITPEQSAEPKQPMGLGSQWETPAFTNYPRQPDVPPTSPVGMTSEEATTVQNPLTVEPSGISPEARQNLVTTSPEARQTEPQGLGSRWQKPAFTLNPNQPVLGDVLAGAPNESPETPVAPGTDRLGSAGPEAAAVDPVAAGGPNASNEPRDGLLSSTRQFNTAPGLATDPAPAASAGGDVAGPPGAEAGQPNRDVLDAGTGAVDEAQNTGLVDQAKVEERKPWRDFLAQEQDPAMQGSILRTVVKRTQDPQDLAAVLDSINPQTMADSGNVAYDVLQSPYATDETKAKAQALVDAIPALKELDEPAEAKSADDWLNVYQNTRTVYDAEGIPRRVAKEQPPARGREDVTGTTEPPIADRTVFDEMPEEAEATPWQKLPEQSILPNIPVRELRDLRKRAQDLLETEGDKPLRVDLGNGRAVDTITTQRPVYEKYLSAIDEAIQQNTRPDTRPTNPRQTLQGLQSKADEYRFNKRYDERKQEVDTLQQSITDKIKALSEEAKARRAAGEDEQTIRADLDKQYKTGLQHLNWLKSNANTAYRYDANGQPTGELNPRNKEAEYARIPDAIRQYAGVQDGQTSQEPTDAAPTPRDLGSDATGLSGGSRPTGAGELGVAGGTELSGRGDRADGAGGVGTESPAATGLSDLDSVDRPALAPTFTETDKDNRFKLTNVADLGGTDAVRARLKEAGVKVPGNALDDNTLQFHSSQRDNILKALEPTNDEQNQLPGQPEQPAQQEEGTQAQAQEEVARDTSLVTKTGPLLTGELRSRPKSPEQWTQDEYVSWWESSRPAPTHRDAAPTHRQYIIDALRAGKTVPDVVLKDYPDIDPQEERQSRARWEAYSRQSEANRQAWADDFTKSNTEEDIRSAITSKPDWQYGRSNPITIKGVQYKEFPFTLKGKDYVARIPLQGKGEMRVYEDGDLYDSGPSASYDTATLFGDKDAQRPYETVDSLSAFFGDVATREGTPFRTLGAAKRAASKLKDGDQYGLVKFGNGYALRKIEYIKDDFHKGPARQADQRRAAPNIEVIQSPGLDQPDAPNQPAPIAPQATQPDNQGAGDALLATQAEASQAPGAAQVEQPRVQGADTRTELVALDENALTGQGELRTDIAQSNSASNVTGNVSRTLEPWQQSFDDFANQQVEQSKYAETYRNQPKLAEDFKSQQSDKWIDALKQRATEGRVDDKALDDFVGRYGVQALQNTFRGQYEKGIEGYMPPDVRADKGIETQTTARKPWHQMTWAEYRKEATPEGMPDNAPKSPKYWRALKEQHRRVVRTALASNKPVPANVLAEYPDLSPANTATSPVTGEAPTLNLAQRGQFNGANSVRKAMGKPALTEAEWLAEQQGATTEPTQPTEQPPQNLGQKLKANAERQQARVNVTDEAGQWELQRYEERKTRVEDQASNGEIVTRRVGDWDNAETSAGSGRGIVNVYWLRNKQTGEVRPFGSDTAYQAMGLSQEDAKRKADKLLKEQRTYNHNRLRGFVMMFADAGNLPKADANRIYRKLESYARGNTPLDEVMNLVEQKLGRAPMRMWVNERPKNAPTLGEDQQTATSTPAQEPTPDTQTPNVSDTLRNDPEAMERVASLVAQAGWAQKGGYLYRLADGTPQRTDWLPKSDWWLDRPDGTTEKDFKETLTRLQSGRKLSPKQERVADFLNDLQAMTLPAEDVVDTGHEQLDEKLAAIVDELVENALRDFGEDAVNAVVAKASANAEGRSVNTYYLGIKYGIREIYAAGGPGPSQANNEADSRGAGEGDNGRRQDSQEPRRPSTQTEAFGELSAEDKPTADRLAIQDREKELARRRDASQAPRGGGLFDIDNRQDDIFSEPAEPPAEPTEPKPKKRKVSQMARAKQAAQTEQEQEKTTSATEDAGEELTYNKRNRIRTGIKWDDIKDKTESLRVKETTKANVYPKPDWETVAQDMDPVIAYLAKHVYDSISTTPATRTPTDADLQTYISAVRRVMDGVMEWIKTAEYENAFRVKANGVTLLDTLYPNGWNKGSEAEKAEIRLLGGSKFYSAIQPGYDERARANREIKKGWPSKQEAWQKQGFKVVSRDEVDIYSGRAKGFLVRVAGNYHSEHDTREQAQAIIDALPPWLVINKRGSVVAQQDTKDAAVNAAREAAKRKGGIDTILDKGIRVTDAKRVGPEYRQPGENITSERLKDTFGFKGVNFGTWMKGKSNEAERQLHLNHAYDSMMDLADLLGVPPKAVSLNGMLGLAIGAQGNGRYAAHFVPGVNEINLTRTSGAGSLGHEWAHALDHYFANQAGLSRATDPFMTAHVRTGGENSAMGGDIRPEIVSRFKAIKEAMLKRPLTAEEIEADRAATMQMARNTLNSWIKSFNANTKLAEDAEYAALMERISNLDMGDGLVMLNKTYYAPPVVAELQKLVKAKHGNYPADQFYGLFRAANHIKHLNESSEASATHEPQTGWTDYKKAAHALDAEKKGKPYWSTPWEMFARAFDAYVSDKIEEKSQRNTYLSHAGRSGDTVPTGNERKAINAAFDALVQEIETRETDQGVAMFSREQNLSPTGRPVQQKVGAILSRDAVQARIDAIRPKLRINPKVTIEAVDSEAELPADIQAQARKEGAVGQVIAVHQGNSIFLVAGKHDSAAKVEESIYHEATHYGANVLFGRAKHAIYNRLYTKLGGEKGIRDYANRLGLKMEPYFATAREARGNLSDMRVNSYLVDEFLANVQGTKAYATLPQKIKTAIQEFYGAIRNWLRQQGFAELAKFTDADLAYLLRSIHQAAQGEVASGRGKPMFMVAWHGSPHDHDKFSTSKIGTGEGNQAFGWGFYFASAKDIAEYYRQKLGQNKPTINYQGILDKLENKAFGRYVASSLDNFFSGALEYSENPSPERLLKAAKAEVRGWADHFAEFPKKATKFAKEYRMTGPEFVDAIREAAQLLDVDDVRAPGFLYQVELAPAENEYLDWHKPLSEQSEKVRGAIAQLPKYDSYYTGGRFYEALSSELRSKGGSEYVSKLMHSLGIRGIRYPAEGQTGGKSGDRFNYVIFDESDVEITAKFSRSPTIDVDGVQRPTTNSEGRPIHSTEEGLRNFWRWFSDSAVTDEQGRPLVVYHGTQADFSEFDPEADPWIFEDDRGLFYFTSNQSEASKYATGDAQLSRDDVGGGNVMPVYVSMANPFIETYSGNQPLTNYIDDQYHLTSYARGEYGRDGLIVKNLTTGEQLVVSSRPNQIKSAIGNTGAFSTDNADIRFSRQYTPEQQAVIDKFAAGQTMQQKPWRDRVREATDNWQTAWAQKVVDRYRSFRDILRNPELWMQARLAGQSEGAVHAGIHFGAPEWDAMGQAIQANLNTKPLEQINQDLGGEINDFFKWVAAQRADRINRKADTAAQMAEILGNDIAKLESQIEALSQAKGNQAERIADLQEQISETRREMNAARKAARIRERFLDDETIEAGLTFDEGTMADGRDRASVYAQALKDFNKLNDAYVNLNVEAGAISEEDAERWRSEGVYVPFYRFLQDDEGNAQSRGLRDLASLDKQTAFKQFKGSAIPLNDLLSNVLANWHHLAHTATHNATAVKALEQASDMGLAERIPESQADDKSLWVREDGKKVFYRLANDSKDAKLVWESIQGMNYQGWKNGAMDAAQAMAGLLRAGVTANPVYRYRNLIRDTMQALATSNVPLNAVVKGWQQTGPKTIEEIQRYANMLASGGLFGIHEAGYLREGNPGAANAKAMLKLGAKPDTDNAILLTQVTLSRMWDKYQDTGARLENVNRAAAFTKTYDETGSLLKAAFEANDLMPFQMRGTSHILFNLSRVVPFFNSRLQGLDKLARSATDPETRQRFWAVTGTYVALSLMAYLALKDDDDYEELEQWKRDAYHYFKVDGQLYKLPRPFEMGVLAMLVERTAEQVFKDVPASLWVDRVMSALGDTFAMNPIPQALKPMVDVYANRDSFTGRPIESLGMENRSKTQRKTPDSSYVGVGVSEALDALFKTMTLGKQETPLSPVQVDELVKGYLGWVGSFALAGSNMILDGLTGAPDKPEDIRRIPIVGDMLNAISESDTPRSTAYSSAFYDHLKIVRQAQADFNQARKLGDARQMQAIRTDKPAAFAAKDAYNKAASSLTDINNMIQRIQAGNDPGDVKKRKLDELTRRKNRITQTIESRFGKTLETF